MFLIGTSSKIIIKADTSAYAGGSSENIGFYDFRKPDFYYGFSKRMGIAESDAHLKTTRYAGEFTA